jgi:hypothetical protein
MMHDRDSNPAQSRKSADSSAPRACPTYPALSVALTMEVLVRGLFCVEDMLPTGL